MSAVSTVTEIVKAIEVLSPLVEQVVEHLKGGAAPEFLTTIPSPLRSEIAYKLAKAKAGT